ncbi:MAG: OmpH family outer membrane protein [Bacteroidota bacterium]
MILNKKSILLTISILLLIVNTSYILYQEFISEPDVVYVDNIQLFDGFNMTKEMKRIGEGQFNTQKSKIDSLYIKIQKSNPAEQQILMKKYVGLKENLEQFNQQFAYEETQKIWKRLHSYVDEFSAEKKYKLIIGSEKKQDVLYAEPNVNITNELINYVNSKYEGAK